MLGPPLLWLQHISVQRGGSPRKSRQNSKHKRIPHVAGLGLKSAVRGEADMDRSAKSAGSAKIDPKETFATNVISVLPAMLPGVPLDFCLYPADDTLDYLSDMVYVLTADRPRYTRNVWLHIALVRNLIPAVHDLRELP